MSLDWDIDWKSNIWVPDGEVCRRLPPGKGKKARSDKCGEPWSRIGVQHSDSGRQHHQQKSRTTQNLPVRIDVSFLFSGKLTGTSTALLSGDGIFGPGGGESASVNVQEIFRGLASLQQDPEPEHSSLDDLLLKHTHDLRWCGLNWVRLGDNAGYFR